MSNLALPTWITIVAIVAMISPPFGLDRRIRIEPAGAATNADPQRPTID